jgi:adenylate cyclase
MARISITIDHQNQTYPIGSEGLSIGRALNNAIVLNHGIVSRSHATIQLRDRDAWIVDLESRNGVFVNRLRVREEKLHDGDLIQIGPFELRFEERAASNIVLDDSKYLPISPAEDRRIESGSLIDLSLDIREFYRLSKRFNSILTSRDLLDAVMEEALKIVPAQRGFLLLQKNNELVPMVVYPPQNEAITLSSTIVNRAFREGKAVLTRDARLDFEGSQSIISANIRSAICVPLSGDQYSSGVIYVDSPGQNQFNERQRDLLAAMANLASVGIERVRLSEELRQQEDLRQNLKRFMSPNVARVVEEFIRSHGQLPEPQELNTSILFADVRGFTTLSEKLSPRDVQDLLNEYLHEMTEVIFQHQGTLDKYIGDGIMALFGAPLVESNQTSTAVQAVSAGLDMLAALRRLVEKGDSKRSLAIRIGINTGPVYAGFFGTRQRLEYTVLGDVVNTAARLEGQAEPNGILISEATRQALGNAFVVEERGELQLKGRQQLVRTYKVIGKT